MMVAEVIDANPLKQQTTLIYMDQVIPMVQS